MESLKSYLASNISDPMRKNHVLVVIKPDFLKYSTEFCNKFAENGYSIVKSKTKWLTLKEAKNLYKIHKDEDFYVDLCNYMSSGQVMAFILKKKSDNIFKEFGKLKDKIREEYGQNEMRNALHSSDSYKNFTHEAGIFFYNIHQHDLTK